MVSNFDKSAYIDWVRVTAKGCITAWSDIPGQAADAWDSFCEFYYSLLLVLWLIILPFLTPFAPIIAWFLRREMRRQQVRQAEAARRAKDRFFRRGEDFVGGAK